MSLDKKIDENSDVKIELTPSELKSLLRIQQVVDKESAEDEIDLSELWQSLIRRKYLIMSLTLLMTLIAAGASINMTSKFESTVLIAPVSSEGGTSGLLAQYGGLASMAGISLPTGSNGISQAQEAQAILTSYRFLSEYIKEKSLKKILFYERWDENKQHWIPQKEGALSSLKKSILGQQDPQQDIVYEGQEVLSDGEPTMMESVNVFKQMLSISEEGKSGLTRLKISWVNPVQAMVLANDLVQRVDDELRQEAILESKEIIAYMQEKLPSIELQDLRMIALKMVEEQLKKITFAEVNKEYVFKVIDPAIVAEKPVSPKKGLIVAVGFVLGLMLSIFIALVLNWREKSKQELT